jgi:D-xylose transport system substrate-binding protein
MIRAELPVRVRHPAGWICSRVALAAAAAVLALSSCAPAHKSGRANPPSPSVGTSPTHNTGTSPKASNAGTTETTVPESALQEVNLSSLRSISTVGSRPIDVIVGSGSPLVSGLFKAALQSAGLPTAQFHVQSPAVGVSEEQIAVDDLNDRPTPAAVIVEPAEGRTVDPSSEALAVRVHADVIDYGGEVTQGPGNYYVGVSEQGVGRGTAEGLAACLAKWHVQRPVVQTIGLGAQDTSGDSLEAGYQTIVSAIGDDWRQLAPSEADFPPAIAALVATSPANAFATASDGVASEVIASLMAKRVGPDTTPVTGVGGTLVGLRNILTGYQCGTVYVPPERLVSSAVILAVYLRSGRVPPSVVLNGVVEGVPASLVAPLWVNSSNLSTLVVPDGAVSATSLCAPPLEDACVSMGIAK